MINTNSVTNTMLLFGLDHNPIYEGNGLNPWENNNTSEKNTIVSFGFLFSIIKNNMTRP